MFLSCFACSGQGFEERARVVAADSECVASAGVVRLRNACNREPTRSVVSGLYVAKR